MWCILLWSMVYITMVHGIYYYGPWYILLWSMMYITIWSMEYNVVYMTKVHEVGPSCKLAGLPWVLSGWG